MRFLRLSGGDYIRESFEAFCTRAGHGYLLDQWDAEKNFPLTPQTVTFGSHKKIWWKCSHGHRWQAAAYTRTGSNAGCPYCLGKRPYPGETDLATVYPHLAAQWHPSKNGTLGPSDVLPGSHRMVWWLCDHGHEWQAIIKSRVTGSGCPVCANRSIGVSNSLAVAYPELADQWHPAKNGMLTPDQVVPGTTRKIWWRCQNGHEWQAAVASRTNGRGCPYCAGKMVIPGENDLASLYPHLADQWHPAKNSPLLPTQVTPYSNRKVWWVCELGHEYQAVVSSRTMRGSACPYCSNRKVLPGFNDLETLEPQIAVQWHPTLNGALTPQMVTVGSSKKVWWECPLGHVWSAVIYSRASGKKCGCPVCAGVTRKNTIRRW